MFKSLNENLHDKKSEFTIKAKKTQIEQNKIYYNKKEKFQDLQDKYEIIDNYQKYGKGNEWQAIWGFGVFWLIFTLQSWSTLFGLSQILSGIQIKIKTVIEKIKNNGLVQYLPESTQNVLIKRSILDILMDIWYIPRIRLYLTTFFKPFFIKNDPELAISNLDTLEPQQRELFLVKGIGFAFPEKIRKVLLGKNQLHAQKFDSKDNKISQEKPIETLKKIADGKINNQSEIFENNLAVVDEKQQNNIPVKRKITSQTEDETKTSDHFKTEEKNSRIGSNQNTEVDEEVQNNDKNCVKFMGKNDKNTLKVVNKTGLDTKTQKTECTTKNVKQKVQNSRKNPQEKVDFYSDTEDQLSKDFDNDGYQVVDRFESYRGDHTNLAESSEFRKENLQIDTKKSSEKKYIGNFNKKMFLASKTMPVSDSLHSSDIVPHIPIDKNTQPKNQTESSQVIQQKPNVQNVIFKEFQPYNTPSRILFCSKTMKKISKLPGRIDSTWDNQELYKRKKELWQNLMTPSDPNKMFSFVLQNQIMGIGKKKESPIKFDKDDDENNKPKEWVVIGTMVFILLLLWSRTSRKWTKNQFFLATFGGSLFTMAYFVFTQILRKKRKELIDKAVKRDNDKILISKRTFNDERQENMTNSSSFRNKILANMLDTKFT